MQPESVASGMIELLEASQNPTEPPPAEDAADRDGNEDVDGAGRGKKRSASSRPENERVAAVQEKNRKAQKRFRERQKDKMSQMESGLTEAKVELGKLREDNSLLAGRNAVLEKVLALREEQLKAVQSGYHLPAPNTSAGMSMGLLNVSGAPPIASSGAAVSAPAAALMSMAAGGPLANLLGGPSPPDVKPPGPGGGGPPPPAWAPIVDELVQLQSRMADPSRDPAIEARYVQLATEAGHLSAKLSPTNRGYGRSDGLPAADGPDPAKWTHLARVLEVSEGKRAEVGPLLGALRERLAAIAAARPALLSAVQTNPASDPHTERQAVADYRLNLNSEHMLCQEFATHMFTRVLTPQQFGIAAVQAHPYYVDAIALAEALTS